ncbi:MAG: hypothetical protein MZW92_23560 [Comamonadaceae bacterium]|nr:hypothetical protein [Comamonadaceae bacterium]
MLTLNGVTRRGAARLAGRGAARPRAAGRGQLTRGPQGYTGTRGAGAAEAAVIGRRAQAACRALAAPAGRDDARELAWQRRRRPPLGAFGAVVGRWSAGRLRAGRLAGRRGGRGHRRAPAAGRRPRHRVDAAARCRCSPAAPAAATPAALPGRLRLDAGPRRARRSSCALRQACCLRRRSARCASAPGWGRMRGAACRPQARRDDRPVAGRAGWPAWARPGTRMQLGGTLRLTVAGPDGRIGAGPLPLQRPRRRSTSLDASPRASRRSTRWAATA